MTPQFQAESSHRSDGQLAPSTRLGAGRKTTTYMPDRIMKTIKPTFSHPRTFWIQIPALLKPPWTMVTQTSRPTASPFLRPSLGFAARRAGGAGGRGGGQ